MRSAAEIFGYGKDAAEVKLLKKSEPDLYNAIIRAIKSGMEEAINEAANVAKTKDEYVPGAQNEWQTIVNINSITELISKIK